VSNQEAAAFASRARSVRKRIIDAIYGGSKGHLGGALSAADVLLYLYESGLVSPSRPGQNAKFPFILSKGHSATALLAVLDELKLAPEELLASYNKEGSLVGNNPSELVPGVEFHTGSLGHGVGLACGVALAHEIQKRDEYVVTMISDGELLEGSIWEGMFFAISNKLNICVIIDRNNQICENFMRDCVDVKNLPQTMKSIGFEVLEIDGHDHGALKSMDKFISGSKAPRVVVANTIKGRGISFMEGVVRWHHSIPNKEEYANAVKELAV